MMYPLDQELLTLLQQQDYTRKTLVQVTGYARSTVYDALMRLKLAGLIDKYSPDKKARAGRPPVYWRVNHE